MIVMAQTDPLVIPIAVKDEAGKSIEKITRQIYELRQQVSGFSKLSQNMSKKELSAAKANVSQLTEVKRRIKEVRNEQRRFKMEYLSILFFGQALMRTFGGIMTSAFQTYNKITEGTSQANNAITRLTASWNFFKFALVEALLNSSLFQMLVEWIIQTIDWLAELNLTGGGFISWLIGGLAILGGFIATGAMLKLTFDSVKLATEGWGAAFKGIATAFNWIKTTAIPGMIAGFNSLKVAIMGNVLGASLLVAAFLLTAVVALALKNQFGSWCNAIKAFVSTIAMGIALVVQFVVDGVKTMLDVVMVILAHLASVAADIASFLGMDEMASQFNKASRQFGSFVTMDIDVVGTVAKALDAAGFNPQPVNNDTNPFTSAMKELGLIDMNGGMKVSVVGAPAAGGGGDLSVPSVDYDPAEYLSSMGLGSYAK